MCQMTPIWAISVGGSRAEGRSNSLIDGVELVVSGDLLVQVRTVDLENDEVPDKVKKVRSVEHAADQNLEFRYTRLRLDAIDGSPRLESLIVRCQRANSRGEAIRYDQQFVEWEEAGDLLFVGLKLFESAFHCCVLIGGVLQLDYRQWQTVYE